MTMSEVWISVVVVELSCSFLALKHNLRTYKIIDFVSIYSSIHIGHIMYCAIHTLNIYACIAF